MSLLDARPVAIPPHLRRGINKRLEESVHPPFRPRPGGEDAAFQRLAGRDPTFGGLKGLTEADVHEACSALHLDLVARERTDLLRVLQAIDPFTPVCSACGELMVRVAGGRVTSLSLGHLCPACRNGQATLIPFRLRKLAWPTGRLVEPQALVDALTLPGYELPLTDEGIREWSDRIDRALDRRLQEEGLSLALFLAYLKDVPRRFTRPQEAPTLLADPRRYGLEGEALDTAILEALTYGNEREPQNVPRLTRRAFLLRRRQPDAPTWTIDGRSYLVDGQIGRGDRSDVYRLTACVEPAEVLVAKVLRVPEEAPAFARARAFLSRTATFESAATHTYARRIHQAREVDTCVDERGVRHPAMVFSDKPGYEYDGRAIREAYPNGVPTHAFGWMAKRLFELLSWLHQEGWAHGAIVPEHLLVLPQDHMVTLLDWSSVGQLGAVVQGLVPAVEAFAPERGPGLRHTRARDVAMACRSLLFLLGADLATGELPPGARDGATEFVLAHAGYGPGPLAPITDTKRQVHDPYETALRAAHGPSRYIPFFLPERRPR